MVRAWIRCVSPSSMSLPPRIRLGKCRGVSNGNLFGRPICGVARETPEVRNYVRAGFRSDMGAQGPHSGEGGALGADFSEYTGVLQNRFPRKHWRRRCPNSLESEPCARSTAAPDFEAFPAELWGNLRF